MLRNKNMSNVFRKSFINFAMILLAAGSLHVQDLGVVTSQLIKTPAFAFNQKILSQALDGLPPADSDSPVFVRKKVRVDFAIVYQALFGEEQMKKREPFNYFTLESSHFTPVMEAEIKKMEDYRKMLIAKGQAQLLEQFDAAKKGLEWLKSEMASPNGSQYIIGFLVMPTLVFTLATSPNYAKQRAAVAAAYDCVEKLTLLMNKINSSKEEPYLNVKEVRRVEETIQSMREFIKTGRLKFVEGLELQTHGGLEEPTMFMQTRYNGKMLEMSLYNYYAFMYSISK